MTNSKETRKKSKEIGIEGLGSISELEADIMKIVWEKKKATVREIHEELLKKEIQKKEQNFIPYTTVMSTMSTLAEKGLLHQDKSAKTYVYSPAVDKKELSKSIIKSVAEKLLEESSKPLVSKFLSDDRNITKEGIQRLLDEIDKL